MRGKIVASIPVMLGAPLLTWIVASIFGLAEFPIESGNQRAFYAGLLGFLLLLYVAALRSRRRTFGRL